MAHCVRANVPREDGVCVTCRLISDGAQPHPTGRCLVLARLRSSRGAWAVVPARPPRRRSATRERFVARRRTARARRALRHIWGDVQIGAAVAASLLQSIDPSRASLMVSRTEVAPNFIMPRRTAANLPGARARACSTRAACDVGGRGAGGVWFVTAALPSASEEGAVTRVLASR